MRAGPNAPRRLLTRTWLWGLLLALDVAALMAAFSLAQLTAEGPAQRTLRHTVAVLAEVDAYLDQHHDALRNDAASTDEDSIPVRGFPVTFEIAADDARSLGRSELRALLLRRAAERIYDDGAAALHPDRDADVGLLSAEGSVRSGLDFLRPTPHRALVIAAALLAVAAIGLSAVLVTSRRWPGVVASGAATFSGAAGLLLFASAVRSVLWLASNRSGDYLATEFLNLAEELSLAPIRNGAAVAACAAIITAVGVGVRHLRPDPRTPPAFD
jgi:hypothetical protein